MTTESPQVAQTSQAKQIINLLDAGVSADEIALHLGVPPQDVFVVMRATLSNAQAVRYALRRGPATSHDVAKLVGLPDGHVSIYLGRLFNEGHATRKRVSPSSDRRRDCYVYTLVEAARAGEAA